MSNYQKQCQSCAMPLENGLKSGTEANGEKSLMYCHFCYENGRFTNPEMTLEQMKVFVDDALKQRGWIAPMRWLAKMQLPSLARWKVK